MITDRHTFPCFKWDGEFYRKEDNPSDDGDLIDGDQEQTEVVILKTKCDPQTANKLFNSGTVSIGFDVYCPLPRKRNICGDWEEYIPSDLKPGCYFRSNMYGMDVNAMVTNISPSYKHGFIATIKGSDI